MSILLSINWLNSDIVSCHFAKNCSQSEAVRSEAPKMNILLIFAATIVAVGKSLLLHSTHLIGSE